MDSDKLADLKIEFGGVVDALPGLVWITQADGRCDFVNRGWREYTGLGFDEATGHGWQTAIHPDDRNSFAQSWDLIGQSSPAKEIDARLRRFDGQYRWFVFRPSPLPENDLCPRRWCWLGLNTDESATTDGRLRRLFDMMPVHAGFLNTAGVLEFTNLQSLKDFGMTFEQLKQWTTSGIIHADDHEKNYHEVTRLLTTGEMMDQELRFLHPNGAYRWIRARCVPVRDAQGNVVRYVTCQNDVDDLKRAEALLAAEVKLLEMVARSEALGQVLNALRRQAEDLCTGSFCAVLMVTPDRKRFEIGARSSLPDACHEVFDGKSIDSSRDPCSLAVVEKIPVVTADFANDRRWQGSPWLPAMTRLGFGSCCATPIVSASGEVSGVLAIYRSGPVIVALQEQEKDLIDRFRKIAGIAIDRTEADAALQARERELRQAYAQLAEGQRLSKTGSFTSDIQQDRHHWSDEFYRIFEIDRATPPRLEAVRDRIHPDDLRLFDAEMQRRFQGGGGDFNFRAVTPKGGLKYLRGVSQVIEHVEDRPIFMGTIQDITESKHAEAALTASEAELRHANHHLTTAQRLSKSGSFTWDLGRAEGRWSDEMLRIFELDPSERATLTRTLGLTHPDDRPVADGIRRRAQAAEDFDSQFRIVVPSGAVKHVRIKADLQPGTEASPVFVGAAQDITESKLAEEGLDRARSELAHVARVATLNAMTASIAHEVSQPLSGILTNANTCVRMLAADPPNLAGAAETARRTIRDANRASEVIKRLRAMFSTKAPALEMADLNDVAGEVIALSMAELRRAGALLQTSFAEGLPHVSVDRVQLQQVILNLLLNAADAMAAVEDRPRTLLVQTALHDDGSVKLLVRDSGTGIDPAVVDRLFDAFYTTKAKGMGVGLSISRSIIARHNGRLWAETNQGPGATFSFCLPAADFPS